MSNFQPLDQNQHRSLRMMTPQIDSIASTMSAFPIGLSESIQASSELPVVFIKDENTGQFRLVCLTGLKPGKNLYFDGDNWLGRFRPRSLLPTPFSFAAMGQKDQLAVCVDIDSPLISSSEGELLFTEEGKQTELLTREVDKLTQRFGDFKRADDFSSYLVERNLLSPVSLTVDPADGNRFDVTGFYSIEESAFNQLGAEDLLSLRDAGFLAFVYALFFSLGRVQDLLNKLNQND